MTPGPPLPQGWCRAGLAAIGCSAADETVTARLPVEHAKGFMGCRHLVDPGTLVPSRDSANAPTSVGDGALTGSGDRHASLRHQKVTRWTVRCGVDSRAAR